MARYIDADLLKSKFEYDNNDSPVYVEATKAIHKIIDECPTVEVVPVVHAYWKYRHVCSHCGYDDGWFRRYKICPNCGAKMDAKEMNNEQV